jgi:hypothetical protein
MIWSICTAKISKNPKNPCPQTKFWKNSVLRQSGQPKISYRSMPSATVSPSQEKKLYVAPDDEYMIQKPGTSSKKMYVYISNCTNPTMISSSSLL